MLQHTIISQALFESSDPALQAGDQCSSHEMPDKGGGWRKKKRPKEPLSHILDRDVDDNTAVNEESNDHRACPPASWRRTVHGIRPETPLTAITTVSTDTDAEDSRSEQGWEPVTPKVLARPKLSWYISKYNTLKDASKDAIFSEPWGEDPPGPSIPLVDPLVALQSIHTHMNNFPFERLPAEDVSGLFRIFEDYKKMRHEQDGLNQLLQGTLEDWKKAENAWVDAEKDYRAEIRRLELLIARGTTGMSGLMKARRGSVIDRKRTYGGTEYRNNQSKPVFGDLTQDRIDEEIKLMSQKVLLHRPSSPSRRMAALSKKFPSIGSIDDMPIGTPPERSQQHTLSRKVKSDLDLSSLSKASTSTSVPKSTNSGFSDAGDPLPDELESSPIDIFTNTTIDCDAYVALRDLGALVARKRGINMDHFVEGLMSLLSKTQEQTLHEDRDEDKESETTTPIKHDDGNATPHQLRQIKSQPLLGSERRYRRHFSFEPGDDQLEALEESFSRLEGGRPQSHSDSTDSEEYTSPTFQDARQDKNADDTLSQRQNLNTEAQKPSNIPSPVQSLGRVRSGSSASSLHSRFSQTLQDERRDSRSSVLTAFRQNSRGSLQPMSKSRGSPISTRRKTDKQPSMDQSSRTQDHNNAVAVAAARAASQVRSSSCSTERSSDKVRTENNAPS